MRTRSSQSQPNFLTNCKPDTIMKLNKTLLAITAALTFATTASATSHVQFNGQVQPSCTFSGALGGTMLPANPERSLLSSQAPGATPGSITVTADENFAISAIGSTTSNTQNLALVNHYFSLSGSGANTFNVTSPRSTRANAPARFDEQLLDTAGTTVIRVDANIEKTGSSTTALRTGTYQSEVTFTCVAK